MEYIGLNVSTITSINFSPSTSLEYFCKNKVSLNIKFPISSNILQFDYIFSINNLSSIDSIFIIFFNIFILIKGVLIFIKSIHLLIKVMNILLFSLNNSSLFS